jgi:hypothetical protein
VYLIPAVKTDIKVVSEAKIEAKKEADKANAEKKIAQEDAAAKKKEAEDALAKVASLTTEISAQTNKVVALDAKIADLEKKLADAKNVQPAPVNTAEIEKLKAELATVQQARDASAQQAKEGADKIKALTDQVAAVEGEKKVIAEKLADVEAKHRVCEGKDGPPLPEGLSGKVLYYDKMWNFTVLDIGKKKGVLPSGVMIVHRGTDIVGKIRVVTVDNDCCIADFLGDPKKKEPKPGDTAIP